MRRRGDRIARFARLFELTQSCWAWHGVALQPGGGGGRGRVDRGELVKGGGELGNHPRDLLRRGHDLAQPTDGLPRDDEVLVHVEALVALRRRPVDPLAPRQLEARRRLRLWL